MRKKWAMKNERESRKIKLVNLFDKCWERKWLSEKWHFNSQAQGRFDSELSVGRVNLRVEEGWWQIPQIQFNLSKKLSQNFLWQFSYSRRHENDKYENTKRGGKKKISAKNSKTSHIISWMRRKFMSLWIRIKWEMCDEGEVCVRRKIIVENVWKYNQNSENFTPKYYLTPHNGNIHWA